MRFYYTDGGREDAGFTGKIQPGDCVCRAIAIATGKPYREVYDEINSKAKSGRKGSRKSRSTARNGAFKEVYKPLLEEWGWQWVPTMQIGSGCKIHLCETDINYLLLSKSTIICRVTKHLVCVKDGVIHDTHDCSRNGTRCVYGYFIKGE